MLLHLSWIVLSLLVYYPPKNFHPEIDDRSGFLSWSVLVLTARDADSLCMPYVLHTVRRPCSDSSPVALKRSPSQALFPGLAAEATGSGAWLNGDRSWTGFLPPWWSTLPAWTLFLPPLTTAMEGSRIRKLVFGLDHLHCFTFLEPVVEM